MNNDDSKTIYTIGHSTRSIEEFVELLKANKIEKLIDIRSFPGSRKYPQFNKENLESSIPKHNIQYEHMVTLGGRRKVQENSQNNRWRNESFRGYADYMETSQFESAAHELEQKAINNRTAIMCSEAVWWRCHRSMVSDMVSDYLKARGWNVEHIMSRYKNEKHPYTSPAIIEGNKVRYSYKRLFDENN